MTGNVTLFKCRNPKCGIRFEKRANPERGGKGIRFKAIRPHNAVTCSIRCSRIYQENYDKIKRGTF